MAPSSLNQVFVANSVTMLPAGTAFNVNTAANVSQLGMYDVRAGDFAVADITGLKEVQFVQTTPNSNPLASPIIDVANIVRINYNGWASDVQTTPIQTWTPPGTITAGKNVMVRIAVRTAPTMYEFYANPANINLDVVGSTSPSSGNKVFPLIGNFSAGRMIFNVEIPAGTNTATAAAACDFVKNAINTNKTLDAIFNFNALAAGTLALTARHQGVEFDMVVQYSDGTGAAGAVVATRFTPASNYAEVISEEKSQRARYGNFNRMYFPVTQTDFAQIGYKYDSIEIAYKHDHPASTGIARAGELNILKIYVGSSSTALAAFANFATVFGVTVTSDNERVTDLVLQNNP
jgi:hypothetical protein